MFTFYTQMVNFIKSNIVMLYRYLAATFVLKQHTFGPCFRMPISVISMLMYVYSIGLQSREDIVYLGLNVPND